MTTTLNSERKCDFVRLDEGKELARSAEVCRALVENGASLQTTGGYASFLNGKVERPHQTFKQMIKRMCYNANLSTEYWCFAQQYANFLLRRWHNHTTSKTPYELWFGRKPLWKNMHIFGCHVYVHNDAAKSLDDNNERGIFLGYGASTSCVYYQHQKNRNIYTSHHVRFDDYSTPLNSSELENMAPGPFLLRGYNHIESTGRSTRLRTKFKLPELETVSSPFNSNNCFTYKVTLHNTGSLGLSLSNDPFFGIPLIESVQLSSYYLIINLRYDLI